MTKSIVQMLLELWQVWCHDHFTEEPVPVTNHPLSEEPFPNVQSELPLVQPHSISSCPVAGHQREISTPWLHCPPWGRCRLRWGHKPSNLRQTTQATEKRRIGPMRCWVSSNLLGVTENWVLWRVLYDWACRSHTVNPQGLRAYCYAPGERLQAG